MKSFFCRMLVAAAFVAPVILCAQGRDVRGGRIVIDDNGDDGTLNTLIIQVPNPLGQNTVLTIPDLGTDSALFVLSSGAGGTANWLLNGNTATTPGIDFLGTADSTALYLYVHGGADNGLILNTNGSIQRDTGGNARGSDAIDFQILRFAGTQVASGAASVVGGGENNTASGHYSTVAGGSTNEASARLAFVGGGGDNVAGAQYSTVGGGFGNIASRLYATIGGGVGNQAGANYATVAGGENNVAAGRYSAIAGGSGLTLSSGAEGSFGFLGGNIGLNDMTIGAPDVAVFGNTDLWLANNDGSASRILFYEAYSGSGAYPPASVFYTSFEAGNQSEDIRYILPTAAPTANGQVLSSDTSGVMSWADGPTGAQSFAVDTNTAPALQLETTTSTNDGTALKIVQGRMVMSSGSGSPANIPDNVMLFEVDDATGSSTPTVGLPASGTQGQLLYVYVADPDGATVGGTARASGKKLTYVYAGGGWRLFGVN